MYIFVHFPIMKNHYCLSFKIILFIWFFMISKQDFKMAILEELKLTIYSFHHCSRLVSIKLTSTNFSSGNPKCYHWCKVWESHIHWWETRWTISWRRRKTKNSQFLVWTNNDGLLMCWLLGYMTEEVLSMVIGVNTALKVWRALEEQLLLF